MSTLKSLSKRELRRRAESQVVLKPPTPDGAVGKEPSSLDPRELIHELRVHQAELEMQNYELRRTQLELEESRDGYREHYKRAPTGYLSLDAAGVILEVNPAAADVLETNAGELVGRHFSSLLTQANADTFHLSQKAVFTSAKKQVFNFSFLTRSGKPLSLRLESIVAEPGLVGSEVPRCHSKLFDFTDLRSAQRQRRAQTSRASAILNASTDAVLSVDAAGMIEMLNPAAEKMFGYPSAQLLARSIRTLIPADHWQAYSVWADALLKGKQLTRKQLEGEQHAVSEPVPKPGITLHGCRQDGTIFPVEVSVGEWRDGKERKFTATVRDLTESLRATEELREKEERFRQIEKNVDAVFYLLELDFEISYLSGAHKKMWGDSKDPRDREQWLESIHPDDVERVQSALEALTHGSGLFDEEYRVTSRKNEFRWVHDRISPVRDDVGSVVRFVGVLTDVSKSHHQAEELIHAQKMEAVGTLASSVAHDFRNLLQGISGCAQMALRSAHDQARTVPLLDSIVGAVKRGSVLTDQLMGFAHRRATSPTVLSLSDTVAHSASLLDTSLGEHVTLELDLSGELPPMLADPVQIEQILMNLAANAADAMPRGGTLRVSTLKAPAGRRDGDESVYERVQLEVSDTGEGMDSATLERVFDPFFTTKGLGKGTGLGLASVFATTKALSGQVHVTSQVDQGTTFTFLFPATEVDPDRETEPPVAALQEVSMGFRGTALLVEDEALVRQGVHATLEELGFDVLSASGASQALVQCEGRPEPIDLLVSDISMPEMCGPELASLVRERYPSISVLFISAHSKGELLERDLLQQKTPFLRKPFEQDKLRERLSKFEGLARTSQTPRRPEATASTAPRPLFVHSLSPAPRAVIMVVEDNEPARSAIHDFFSEMGYVVLAAARPSEALALSMAHEGAIDLLLCDLRLPEMNGEDLVRTLSETQPRMQVVFMSGLQELPDGVEGELLRKPIDLDVLEATVVRKTETVLRAKAGEE